MPLPLPLVAPAPLVSTHAAAFRDLCENRCLFAHVKQYRTGLMVRENKSRATGARCVRESADKRRTRGGRARDEPIPRRRSTQSPRGSTTAARATSPRCFEPRSASRLPHTAHADNRESLAVSQADAP